MAAIDFKLHHEQRFHSRFSLLQYKSSSFSSNYASCQQHEIITLCDQGQVRHWTSSQMLPGAHSAEGTAVRGGLTASSYLASTSDSQSAPADQNPSSHPGLSLLISHSSTTHGDPQVHRWNNYASLLPHVYGIWNQPSVPTLELCWAIAHWLAKQTRTLHNCHWKGDLQISTPPRLPNTLFCSA